MMAEPIADPGILKIILDWAWAGVLGLVAVVYKANDKKHADSDRKAEAIIESLETHRKEDRETFKELFHGQTVILEHISQLGIDLNKTMSGIHVSVLSELSKKADK